MMRRIALLALAIGFFVPFLASAPAHAQASRTWVSGVGDDANPCSRTAPCKTFAGAISKTAIAGEIDCLDPGGFGGVTITKAITLNCSATLGSILVAGTPGITINAGASDKVIIRNLQIQGLAGGTGPAGTFGIRILSAAAVSIENCVITQFAQQGISDVRTAGSTKLFIRNTVVSFNAGSGIDLSAANPNSVEIDNMSSINNLNGLSAASGNFATIQRSAFSSNSSSGIQANAGAILQVAGSAITSNGTGVTASGIVWLSNSSVAFNSTGFSGAAVSFGNNQLLGNGTFGTPVTAAGAASTALGQQ
jgi:hypothetical protein